MVYLYEFVIPGKYGRDAMRWCIHRGSLQGNDSVGEALDQADWMGDSYVSGPEWFPDVQFGFTEEEADLAILFKLRWVGRSD